MEKDSILIDRQTAVEFLRGEVKFSGGHLMVKGYSDDWDMYTEVYPEEELDESILNGDYDNFEIWFF